MTFYEAIVPACLQMHSEGAIRLCDFNEWSFEYVNVAINLECLEDRTRKISGVNEGGIHKKEKWTKFCEECKKAAELIREIEESPLGRALK